MWYSILKDSPGESWEVGIHGEWKKFLTTLWVLEDRILLQ